MAAKARFTQQGFDQVVDDLELMVVAGPDEQGMFICVPSSAPLLLAKDEFDLADDAATTPDAASERYEHGPSFTPPEPAEPALPAGVSFAPRMMVAPCGAPGPSGRAFDGITCELPDHGEGAHRAFVGNHLERQWADDLTWTAEASRKS